MFREISVWHLVIILAAFVLLFGYKRLPDATRSLGRSMRILKSEVKGLHDDDEPKQVSGGSTAAPQAQTQQAQAPQAQTQPSAPAAEAPRRSADVSGRSDADRA